MKNREPEIGNHDSRHSARESVSYLRPATSYLLSTILLLIVGSLFPSRTHAQHVVPETPPLPPDRVLEPGGGTRFVGVDVGMILNFHSGVFSLMQDGLICCQFDGGNGVGGIIRVRGEYFPGRDEKWGVAARLSIEGNGGTFESNVQTLPIFGLDNKVEKADFQNTVDVSLPSIDLTGLAMYKIGTIVKTKVDAYALAGLSLTNFLSSTFDKTERIIGPSGVRYLDGTTEKFFPNVEVDQVNPTQFGLSAGLSIRYPVAPSLFVGWELLYRLPLTNIASEEEWGMTNLLFSAGLSMAL